jgi:hypothetical protein
VLGGSSEANLEDRTPDPALTRAIIDRCAVLEPRLADARVLSVAVGLRPARTPLRLEAETRDGGLVIHNYGHGGAGVTLSWGCAEAGSTSCSPWTLRDAPATRVLPGTCSPPQLSPRHIAFTDAPLAPMEGRAHEPAAPSRDAAPTTPASTQQAPTPPMREPT